MTLRRSPVDAHHEPPLAQQSVRVRQWRERLLGLALDSDVDEIDQGRPRGGAEEGGPGGAVAVVRKVAQVSARTPSEADPRKPELASAAKKRAREPLVATNAAVWTPAVAEPRKPRLAAASAARGEREKAKSGCRSPSYACTWTTTTCPTGARLSGRATSALTRVRFTILP